MFSVAEAFRQRDRGSRSRIWAGPLEGPLEPLTAEGATDLLPTWTPGGATICFASDRHTPGRVGGLLLVDPSAGAEPRLLSTFEGRVEALDWVTPSAIMALVADPEAESASMQAAVRPEVGDRDPLVLRRLEAWRRLFRVDPVSGETAEVGPEGWTLWEVAYLGADAAAAVASEDPSENGWYRSSIVWLDLRERVARPLHRSPDQIASPAVSPDGQHVAFVEGWASDRGLVHGEVRVVAPSDGRSIAVPREDVAWVGWRDSMSLWFAAVRGLGTEWGWVSLDGARGSAWTAAGTLRGAHQAQVIPSPAGDRVATILDAPGHPPEIAWQAVGDAHHGWRRSTRLNDGLADLAGRCHARPLRWSSTDGTRIEGLLVEPVGGPNGARPLIVDIHGGPTWAFREAFLPFGAPLAIDLGYPVLLVNYRGTPGYGTAFTRGNVGDPGGMELADILTGIDACVQDGIADDARVGVLGGSYGGYLTAWAVTQTDRFACGIVISGISDLVSCHRTCNNPAFYDLILERTPHGAEALGRYLDRSPIAHVAKVRTPTLILHGEKDLCTPIGQAQELYQALAEQGTQVELVVYPREGHGAGNWEREHQLDYHRRIRDWLVRHLEPGPA
ncbi:MAG: S9 family peptidase [Candidatus Limnocylindrales bacterium]